MLLSMKTLSGLIVRGAAILLADQLGPLLAAGSSSGSPGA
jgi:hypothetical protein